MAYSDGAMTFNPSDGPYLPVRAGPASAGDGRAIGIGIGASLGCMCNNGPPHHTLTFQRALLEVVADNGLGGQRGLVGEQDGFLWADGKMDRYQLHGEHTFASDVIIVDD